VCVRRKLISAILSEPLTAWDNWDAAALDRFVVEALTVQRNICLLEIKRRLGRPKRLGLLQKRGPDACQNCMCAVLYLSPAACGVSRGPHRFSPVRNRRARGGLCPLSGSPAAPGLSGTPGTGHISLYGTGLFAVTAALRSRQVFAPKLGRSVHSLAIVLG